MSGKIRSIHPSFFTDAKVNALTFPARHLFAGLWCFSDDYGRGYLLPKAIEGNVFPRDTVDIDALLGELIDAGLIRVYSDGTDDFYEIPKWSDYQSPKYQAKSSIPNPETLKSPGHTVPGQSGDKSGTNPGQTPPDLSPGEGVERELSREGVKKIAPDGAEPETDDSGLLPAVIDIDTGLVAEAKSKPAPNPWWDTLTSLFGQPTHPQRSLYGRMAKLAQATGPPSEIHRRAEHIALTWGADKLTIASLEKHWNRADSAVGQVGDIDQARIQAEREQFRRTGDAELARQKAQKAARMRGTR